MANRKLSSHAVELLIVISERSTPEEGGVCWVPPSGIKNDWSDTLGRFVFVDGSSSAAALRALRSRGLICKAVGKEGNLGEYASRITEEGALLIESWRENEAWPVKVAV